MRPWRDVTTEAIACGVLFDGTTHCYGSSGFFTEPQSFPDTTDAVQVELALHFGCTLDSEGQISCFGCEYQPENCDAPLGEFTLLKSSTNSMCAMHIDGRLFCWGHRDVVADGPIGNFDVGPLGVAVLPPGGGTVRWYPEVYYDTLRPPPDVELMDIATDSRHSCGLHLDGTPECWGEDATQQPFPQPFDPGPYVQIETTGHVACARRTDDTVFCWAPEWYIALSPDLVKPPQDEHFTHFDMGWVDACGLRADGTATCWGPCCGVSSINGEWPDWE